MPEIVERLGPVGALRWFAVHMPRYERTRGTFGALRTHLLGLEISLLNGCPYCTFGHAYAFELLYLEATGRLFPLDEHAIVGLQGTSEALLQRVLSEALERADLREEVPWLQNLLQLRNGKPPSTDADRRISHLLEMFGVLNACGISGRVDPDEAHDPINKDTALKARYTALREIERARSVPPPVDAAVALDPAGDQARPATLSR